MIIYHINPVNPIALRTAKTLWSFGCSECSRGKPQGELQFREGGPYLGSEK